MRTAAGDHRGAGARMPLVGRAGELATLRGLVESARAGRGGALVVHGDAGIGKTALVAAALAAETGIRSLSAAGSPDERDLPFAGLHQLLQPLPDRHES